MKRTARFYIGLGVIGALAVVALANVHLVYVAVTTQPDCVAHQKTAGTAAGVYRAAKSAC